MIFNRLFYCCKLSFTFTKKNTIMSRVSTSQLQESRSADRSRKQGNERFSRETALSSPHSHRRPDPIVHFPHVHRRAQSFVPQVPGHVSRHLHHEAGHYLLPSSHAARHRSSRVSLGGHRQLPVYADAQVLFSVETPHPAARLARLHHHLPLKRPSRGLPLAVLLSVVISPTRDHAEGADGQLLAGKQQIGPLNFRVGHVDFVSGPEVDEGGVHFAVLKNVPAHLHFHLFDLTPLLLVLGAGRNGHAVGSVHGAVDHLVAECVGAGQYPAAVQDRAPALRLGDGLRDVFSIGDPRDHDQDQVLDLIFVAYFPSDDLRGCRREKRE